MRLYITFFIQWLLFMLFLFTASYLDGQTRSELRLTEAYQLLENRYPLLKNEGTLSAIYQQELDRIDKTRMPSIHLKADGRLQSEAVQLDLPEGSPFPLEIDQPPYSLRTYFEGQYVILDGGFARAQKAAKEEQLAADLQQIEVDRFSLRGRLNQIFLQIQLLRSQVGLFDLSLQDIQARREQAEAGVENGVLLESELTRLEVRSLELEAQQKNLSYLERGLVQSIEDLLDISLSDSVKLLLPDLPEPLSIPDITRPEQQLFQAKRQAILAKGDLIDVRRQPRLAAFAQAGVGYPNPLNFLDPGFAPYGLAGFQFSWQITDWGKDKLDKEILSLQATKLHHAEETFEFNLRSREATYRSEVARLEAQVQQDEAIARLQAEILEQLAIQLDEGVLTTSEYLLQVNAELRARQNVLIHQIELRKAQLDFWSERGAY